MNEGVLLARLRLLACTARVCRRFAHTASKPIRQQYSLAKYITPRKLTNEQSHTDIDSRYRQKIQRYDSLRVSELARSIVELTTRNTHSLELAQPEFKQVFRVPWLRTLSEAGSDLEQLEEDPNVDCAALVHELTSFNYLNNSHKIASVFRRRILDNEEFTQTDLAVFNDLVDFFSSKGDAHMVKRVFDKMGQLEVSPTTTTFNLIAKNYIARTDIVLERLSLWESILKHMIGRQVYPDAVSWYITLSVLPTQCEIKRFLQTEMRAKGIAQMPKYHDVMLTDKLNMGQSVGEMLKYFEGVPVAELDVHCVDTVIYKLLACNEFEKAWKFMNRQASRGLRPRNSTLTILLKHCKVTDQLELMIRVLNTMKHRYRLVNYTANQLVLDYLLKLPDGSLPTWYPLLVKYVLRHDLAYGIGRYRRLDVMVKRLQYKINANFERCEDRLSELALNRQTEFETLFMGNLGRLLVLESDHDRAREYELFQGDGSGPDGWIKQVMSKSYYDLVLAKVEAVGSA